MVEAKKQEIRIAYIVSNFDYEKYSNKYQDLPGAQNDGKQIKQFLEKQCGFKTHFYENIGNKEFDQIEIDADDESSKARKQNQFLILFFYYAGHGESGQMGNVKAITIEKDQKTPATFDISEVILNLSGKRDCYLISLLDCCRVEPEKGRNFNQDLRPKSSYYFIYGALPGRIASDEESTTKAFIKYFECLKLKNQSIFRHELSDFFVKGGNKNKRANQTTQPSEGEPDFYLLLKEKQVIQDQALLNNKQNQNSLQQQQLPLNEQQFIQKPKSQKSNQLKGKKITFKQVMEKTGCGKKIERNTWIYWEDDKKWLAHYGKSVSKSVNIFQQQQIYKWAQGKTCGQYYEHKDYTGAIIIHYACYDNIQDRKIKDFKGSVNDQID